MKQTLILPLLLLGSIFCYGQDAGVNIYSGLTQGQFTNQNYTTSDEWHKGYTIMIDARLTDGPSYMIGGVGLNKVNMISGTEHYFTQDFSMNWLKVRAGIGFKLLEIASSINVHGEILASANILTDYPQVVTPLPTSDLINYSFSSMARIKVFVSFLSIGLEYDRGFTDLVADQGLGTSKFNNWALTAGVFF